MISPSKKLRKLYLALLSILLVGIWINSSWAAAIGTDLAAWDGDVDIVCTPMQVGVTSTCTSTFTWKTPHHSDRADGPYEEGDRMVLYQWSRISGEVELMNRENTVVSVTPTKAGVVQLMLRVLSGTDASWYRTKVVGVTVAESPVTMAIDAFSCPKSVYVGSTFNCTGQASSNVPGEISYKWNTASGAGVGGSDTPTASITATTVGRETVTFKVSETPAPADTFQIGWRKGTSLGNDILSDTRCPGYGHNTNIFAHSDTLIFAYHEMGSEYVMPHDGFLTSFHYTLSAYPDPFWFVLYDASWKLMWMSPQINDKNPAISPFSDRVWVPYHTDNATLAPVPVKQGWRLGIVTSGKFPFPFLLTNTQIDTSTPGWERVLLTNAYKNRRALAPSLSMGLPLERGIIHAPMNDRTTSMKAAYGAEGVTAINKPVEASTSAFVSILEMVAPKIVVDSPKTLYEGQTGRFTVTPSMTVPVTVTWKVADYDYNSNPLDISFPEPGKQTIEVSVYPNGFPDLVTKATIPITVTEVKAPTISVKVPRTGEVGYPMTLAGSIKAQAGPATIVKWEMPDGTTVNDATATYTPRMEDIGTATFRIIAYPESLQNKMTVTNVKITISKYDLPVFTLKNYTQNTGMTPHKVTYTANANLKGITEKFTYKWDMGDGSGAVLPNTSKASYTYNSPGVYTVTLLVSDTRGNSATITDTVTVTTVPPISIDSIAVTGSNQALKVPLTAVFKPTISGGNPKVDKFTTYVWTIDSQQVGKNTNRLAYEFKESGTYVVALTVTAKSGLTGSGSVSVVVNPNTPPDCSITYEDFPLKNYTKLVGDCTDPDGRIKELIWDLGDGTTSRSKTVSKKYAAGTYTVTLSATDDSNDKVTVSKEIVVNR